MELEIFWGFITLIGITMAIKYRTPFKQFIGPMLIPDSNENYYIDTYIHRQPFRMISNEHSAQLDGGRRIEIERAFRNNDLDVMVCTPTMEMGVDTEPDTQKYLGDRIISLNDEWKNQKPINCATEKRRFGIFFKSFSNYGQPVLSLPNEIVPDAEAIILAPLFLRPGKARRLECCDVSTRLEISLQNPGTINNESIAFKVDVKELKIEDDCIKVDVKSLNHAYTKASLRLEPHRRSHGGRVYEHIAMKSENDKYVPLETIRKEYEKELKSQLIFS